MAEKLKSFPEKDMIKALKDPKIKKKLKKLADEFIKKQQEDSMKPKFMENNGCNYCCCRRY